LGSAEFRGPGVHHNFDDSDSGYDNETENKSKPFGIGGYKGRIIFLGDGTEVLTDSDDAEMFDNAEEDKDLASQVSKKSAGDEAESSDPLPRAPSPPAREKKSAATTSDTKTDSTTKDTPAEEAKTESSTDANAESKA
jgi:protein phosphatase 2C family protein 2/3